MSDVKVTIPRDDYNPNQRTDIDVEVVNPDGTVSTRTVEGAVQSTTQEDGSVSFGILASAHVPFGASTTYDEAVAADTPVLWWKFGESSGTTVTDSSSSGYSGTYTGSPTLGVTGIPGSTATAVTLDGTDDIASRTYQDVFRPGSSNGAIIEFWYKGTATGANIGSDTDGSGITAGLVGLLDAGTPKRWIVAIDADGKVRAYSENDLKLCGPSTTTVNDGNWHHIVFRMQAGTYDTTIYVDGSSEATATAPNDAGSLGPSLQVGYSARAGTYTAGTFAHLAIYHESVSGLSDARILAHYNAGI